MLNKTKAIRVLKSMKRETSILDEHKFTSLMDLSRDEARAEIILLINEGFIIDNTHHSSFVPNGMYQKLEAVITNKCDDYIKENRSIIFFKWYPIIISTLALLVSILVTIYK